MKIWTLAVHPWDLRRKERSFHSGAAPGPTYPPIELMPHVELTHPVKWSPMGAKFGGSVFGDTQAVALLGHDSGVGIPHACTPPDNLDLPLTILTSMCKWLFASTLVTTEGQAIVGFAPYAPYLGCHAPVAKPGTRWLPLQGTVVLPMSAVDLLMGWARVFATIGVEAVCGALMGKVRAKAKPIDDVTAARVGRGMLERHLARRARVDQAGVATANEMLKGLTVSVVVEGKVKLPYQLAEFSVAGDGAQLLVWQSNTSGEGGPYLMKALEPEIAEAPEDTRISPELSALVEDLPLVGGREDG